MTGLWCSLSLRWAFMEGPSSYQRYSGYTRQKKLADERRGSALFLLLGLCQITNFGGERHASLEALFKSKFSYVYCTYVDSYQVS